MARITRHLAIVVLAWIGVSIAAEGAFRLLGDRPTFDLQGMYAPFEDGTYRLASNVDTEANWSSGRLTVHTDTLGLRCDAERRFATKPNDSIDGLILGDSQGFGNGVSFEESLAGSLVVAASRDGSRLANAAVGGHSAATQLLLAEWLRERQGLKAANYILLVTPAMGQSGGHLSRANVGRDGRLYGSTTNTGTRARTWVKTNLVVYARIRDALKNSGTIGEPTKETPFVFKFYEAGAAEDTLRQSFSEYIARFKRFASAAGAQIQIVYIPLTLELEFEPVRSAAAARGIIIDPDVPRRACEAVARQFGLPFCNLKPVLEQLHAEGKPLHLRGDFHYDRELSVACGNELWTALKPHMALSTANHPNSRISSHGE